ncbi:ABC transporter substrate-binding protein [Thermodesulfobacteriota bacterium]
MLPKAIKTVLLSISVCVLLGISTLPTCAEKVGQGKNLKVALLPILDVFPFYVAEAEGYFSEEGVKAEAIPVASGLARDQLMQAGEIDAMLNEMASTASYNRESIQVKILSTARKPFSDYPMFRILSAPKISIKNNSDLMEIPIGISKNTIIEYVTDRLLSMKGLKPEQINKKSVPSIPERYQLLIQGRIKAATLPDPMGLSALSSGANEIISDAAYPQYSISVLSFNIKAINNKSQEIKRFLRAWHRAAKAVNDNPEIYRQLLLDKVRVPPNVQNGYPMPHYPVNEIPTPSEWSDVMAWMVEKGLLNDALPYETSVSEGFLP